MIAESKFLKSTRDSALKTPGINWVDEDTAVMVGGRETRKMNTYQAVRDAMGYVPYLPECNTITNSCTALPLPRTTMPSCLERTSLSVVYSGVQWSVSLYSVLTVLSIHSKYLGSRGRVRYVSDSVPAPCVVSAQRN